MRREGTPTGSPERKLGVFHQKARGQAKVWSTFVVILLLVCNVIALKTTTSAIPWLVFKYYFIEIRFYF